MSESVILCEGYHDRAFWDGWLKYIGCMSLKPQPGKPVYDPFSEEVKGGQYAYSSTNGDFIRVTPCHGKEKILPIAKIRLKQRVTKRLLRLVVNVDSDKNADGTQFVGTAVSRQAIRDMLLQFDPTMQETAQGDFAIDGGATEIAIVRWQTTDEPSFGLPNQQTLERLVCSALVAAYPKRGPCVQNWLDTRDEPPEATVKEFAWSYMAGWHAEYGCEGFYQCLWDDKNVAEQLKSRLESSGAWRVAEALAS